MSYNFRTVMGQSSYKAWKQWSAGDYLVGKYLSQGEDQFGNPNYKVETIESEFENGDDIIKGAVFSFNSSGALNKAMEEVEVGDVIKVIYKGEDTISKGKFKGKAFHSMEVLVAPKDGSTSKAINSSEEDDLI